MIFIGAGLRVWQFTGDTSLYVDEVAVAHNILDQPLVSLLTGQLPDQVAPKGFLFAAKVAVWMLGPTDSALRMFSLVCSLASLFMFWRIAIRLPGGAGPLAMALFAGAVPLVSYGSEVKQYSGDVFFTLLLLWLALKLASELDSSVRTLRVAGLTGAVAVWFSQPATLVLASLAMVLFFVVPQKRTRLIPVFSLWGVSALAATVDALRSVNPEIRDYVRQVWAGGFLPLLPAVALAVRWPWNQIQSILGGGLPAGLSYPWPTLYFGLIVLGYWVLWRRQRVLSLCLAAPVAATLGAAIAHLYPFSDRLILFLIPIALLAMGTGIERIREWASRGSHPFWSAAPGWLAYGALGGAALLPIMKFPPVYHVEDMKPVMAYLQTQRRPEDRIYTYYAAAPSAARYASQYGLHDSDYAVGGCHRGDGRRYLEELDTFRGNRRVWVLFTHSLPEFQEREDMLRYLDAIGIRRTSFVVISRTSGNRGFPAEVYLYDLSDPVRLSQAAALKFPLLGPQSPQAQSRCLHGPQVMIPPRGL